MMIKFPVLFDRMHVTNKTDKNAFENGSKLAWDEVTTEFEQIHKREIILEVMNLRHY